MREGIRVAVVDDHPLFRQGVAHTLNGDKHIELIAQGAHCDDVQRIASEQRPQILLLDILLRSGGVKALKSISQYLDQTKVIVVTASEKMEHVSVASTLGARGFVSKTETGEALIAAVHAIHRGETYVTPHLAANMFKNLKRRKAALAIKSELKSLTKRESEILGCVGRGLTNKEIAIKLGLREKTVKHYMTNIMNKLQVQNRVQAALLARQSEPMPSAVNLAG